MTKQAIPRLVPKANEVDLRGDARYRYRLFLVEHGLDLYPVWLSSGRDDAAPVEVPNEEALYAELRARFASEETLRIVRQLHTLAAEAHAVGAAAAESG